MYATVSRSKKVHVALARSTADAASRIDSTKRTRTRFVRENSAKLSRRPAGNAKNTDEVHRPYTITASTVRCTFTQLAPNPLSVFPPLLHATLSFRAESAASDGPRPVSLPIEQTCHLFAEGRCLKPSEAD